MAITVAEVTDERLIRAFLRHPEIFKTIIEDGGTDFTVDFRREKWIGFFDELTVIGLYNLEVINHITLEIHAHVLPKFRKEFSKITGHKILEYIYDRLPDYRKVVAYIPMLYENVYVFTKSFGFQDEGVNRQSHMRDGEIYDVWCLGITRAEIRGYLDEQN